MITSPFNPPQVEVQENRVNSNVIIYVDCHASNRGLFAGLFMTVASVISIVLFFVFSSSDKVRGSIGATLKWLFTLRYSRPNLNAIFLY